ncbi:hypothetical protein ID866_9064 [Astraeus odoratus]|nr:hypothetical protein ID866_9064 [Astraeus odoratus]
MIPVSPGLNPSIAVLVGEKKVCCGAPASVKIFGLLTLNSVPTCSKTFYKTDRAQIKWNELATQALIVTQTEVNNSNMSYYGETSLYLLSIAGNFHCCATLDKEGPIHDVAWSPNSKEFGVVSTNIIDQRTLTKLTTIEAPNTSYCAWSPWARFLLTAVLFPRPRVDNGIKVCHCTGLLIHVQPIDELYQAGWRPTAVDQAPAFGQMIPPAP